MKKIVLVVAMIAMLIPNNVKAQNDGVAAGVGALLAIGGAIAAIKQMEEAFELQASQHVLQNTDMERFELKIFDLTGGTKGKDISDVSIFSFKIKDFGNDKHKVLLALLSSGWKNQFGVDYNKVKWVMMEVDEWNSMMGFYVNVASGINIPSTELANYKIVNKGIKDGKTSIAKFDKVNGDTYLVGNYSNEYKIVFNERSLGLFVKETVDLVQIRRGTIIKIHEFLNKQ